MATVSHSDGAMAVTASATLGDGSTVAVRAGRDDVTVSSGGRVLGRGELRERAGRTARVTLDVAEGGAARRDIAALLLERLVARAEHEEISTLSAEVEPSDRDVIAALEHLGLPVRLHATDGTLRVTVEAAPTPESRVRLAERRAADAVQGLDRVLRPSAVAVVGTCRQAGAVGGQLTTSLIRGGFHGDVHVVHCGVEHVAGIPALESPSDLPPGVDLALLADPAEAVLESAEACAAAGVGALAVMTGGFADGGPEGQRRGKRLAALCREAGMRLLGPGCMGLASTDPEVQLHATLAPQRLVPGAVALASQSGAVGAMAMHHTARRGMGLSAFVSLGDRADVSSNDLLRYWAEDPRTHVIALYLESFGNPRAFAAVAREVTAIKPVVAVKAGRRRVGGRGRETSFVDRADRLVDALLADAGVIRVDTIGELLDTAAVLAQNHVPAEPRIGILSNATSAGLACADACERAGLRTARLRPLTRRALEPLLSAGAADDRVDLQTGATAVEAAEAAEALMGDPGVDVVVALHVAQLGGHPDHPLPAVADAAEAVGIPVVAVPLAQAPPPGLGERVPIVESAEEAVRAVERAAVWTRWSRRGPDPAERPHGLDRAAGAAVIAEALARGDEWMAPELARRLADAYALPVAPEATAAGGVGEVELLIGAVVHPAFGPVVGCGAGGTLAEVLQDVAVRLAPIGRRGAREMVESLRVHRLLQGWRGAPRCEVQAVEDAVRHVATLIHDRPEIREVVIDPLLATPEGVTAVEVRVRLAR